MNEDIESAWAMINTAELARRLDLTPQTVARWRRERVPAERVADVERLTGIPREDLRPDIFRTKPHQEQPNAAVDK